MDNNAVKCFSQQNYWPKLTKERQVVATPGLFSMTMLCLLNDPKWHLFTAIIVGFTFVHFVVQQSPLPAAFEIDFSFKRGVAKYHPIIHQVCHMKKIIVAILE